MKLIKLALISIVILFAIVTSIGLLFPNKVIVSRAIDINTSANIVYTNTHNLLAWKGWVSSLQNNNITNPLQTNIGTSIIKINTTTPQKITGEWIEKNGDKQQTVLSIIPSNAYTTIVQWQFEQNIAWYPWARLSSMINDKVIGAMMESNLANLKKLCEK